MPATVPEEQRAEAGALPESGLPASALTHLGCRPFGLYVHVPFCAARCGYCDFNTYTDGELGGEGPRRAYADTAPAEVHRARRVLGAGAPPVASVFVGGGTPTTLPPDDLDRVLRAIDAEFGLPPGAEVTTEANPESVDGPTLARLRELGFTRVSLGMQSARPHVLRALDRRHAPDRARQAVREAHAAGFEHVNLDLVYGAPGETGEDWEASLRAAIAAGPDHVSAYSLVVEEGTRLAARVRRGELLAPDDDVLAERYRTADRMLSAAGFAWYEVSTWAAGPSAQCRHNLLYSTGADWWGIGPGAHSHVGGVRWWNVDHPVTYAGRLRAGRSPASGGEVLGPEERHLERVLLSVRLVTGCPLAELTPAGRAEAGRAVGDGLLEPGAYRRGRAVLTRQGRLLADAVVRRLAA